MSNQFDVAIIGGGPGGYVAAIRLAQLGKKVAIVEKRKTLGGTCLNVGCIPSKALLDSSEHYWHTQNKLGDHGIEVSQVRLNLKKLIERKNKVVSEVTQGVDYLMKKNKITRFEGTGFFTGNDQEATHTIQITKESKESEKITAENVVIASGSEPISLKDVPVDGKNIITSDHAINLTKVPKHLIIIGAGVIGLELGSVWKRLGAQVTIIEFMPNLMGTADRQMSRLAQRILESQGMKFLLEHRVLQAKKAEDKVEILVEDKNKKQIMLESDILLVAVGRKPVIKNLQLDKVNITRTERNCIKVDPKTFQTNVPGIYAIGDVIEGPMLAHKASEEGVAVAEIIAGKHGHVNYLAIPWIIYTWPEIAWIGYGEEELKEKGVEYEVGKSIFRSNARSKAMNEVDGQVKIIADKKSDKVLGIYIIGPRASDMIAEAAIGAEFGASAEDLARAMHAHPTLSEIIKEAAMDVGKWALHA